MLDSAQSRERIMSIRGSILDFIATFKPVAEFFQDGHCYWFAEILHGFMEGVEYADTRVESVCGFGDVFDDGRTVSHSIVYEPVEGHFLVSVRIRDDFHACNDAVFLFDVTGDVSGKYQSCTLYPTKYLYLKDRKWYNRLLRDCKYYGHVRMNDETVDD